jgi:hypothetical protein
MAGDEIRFGCRNYRKESQRGTDGMLTYGRGQTMERRSANIELDKKDAVRPDVLQPTIDRW